MYKSSKANSNSPLNYHYKIYKKIKQMQQNAKLDFFKPLFEFINHKSQKNLCIKT